MAADNRRQQTAAEDGPKEMSDKTTPPERFDMPSAYRNVPSVTTGNTLPPAQQAADLVGAVLRFERAATEFRRAKATGAQPRLQRAGNRHYTTKCKLFALAREMANGAR